MNTRWIIHIGMLIALGTIVAACRESSPIDAGKPDNFPTRSVELAPASQTNLERAITVSGSFLAQEKVTLRAKVPGRLEVVKVDLGTPVAAGAIVAQIEPREYELRVRQAEAALTQALAAIGLGAGDESKDVDPAQTSGALQASAVLNEARASRDRAVTLHHDGVLSQAELDTAESAYTVAENRYRDAVEAGRQKIALVAQRRIERDIAAQQLADTKLVAPFKAAVQERAASQGEYLQAGDPVATLIQVDPLRLRLEVSERDAPLIRTQQLVRAHVEGLPTLPTGRIVRISPAIDQQRRVLLVEADLPNEGVLHPGMFARADIVVNANQPAVTVPSGALVTFAGIEKVFTIVDGAARERVITTGRRGTNWVEIVDNLKPGEKVILNPGNLQNGQPVSASRPDSSAAGRTATEGSHATSTTAS